MASLITLTEVTMAPAVSGFRSGGGPNSSGSASRLGVREARAQHLYEVLNVLVNFASPIGTSLAAHSVNFLALVLGSVGAVLLSWLHHVLEERTKLTRLLVEITGAIVWFGVVERLAYDGWDMPIIAFALVALAVGLWCRLYGDPVIFTMKPLRHVATRTIGRSVPRACVQRLDVVVTYSEATFDRVEERPRGPCGPGSFPVTRVGVGR